MDSPYGQLPSWGAATPPPPFGNIRESFDIDRGLRRGIAAIRKAPWVLLLGGFLKSCTEGGGGAGINNLSSIGDIGDILNNPEFRGHGGLPFSPGAWAQAGSNFPDLSLLGGLGVGVIIAVVLALLVVALVFFLFGAWINAGWIRVHEELVRTGKAQLGTLFGAGDVFGSMVGWLLISALLGVATLVVSILPLAALFAIPDDDDARIAVFTGTGLWAAAVVAGTIYLRVALALVPHIITLERQGVMAAIERSFLLTQGGRLHLLLYMGVFSFIGVLVMLPGYCLCFVAVFFTRALGVTMRDFGYTEGFLRLTQPPETVAAYSINTWGDD